MDMMDNPEGTDDVSGNTASDINIIIGDETDNVLTGTDAADEILGLGGDDVLDGGAGPDALFGGEGGDTLLGGEGDDELFGDGGADTLVGALGNDVLFGGTGTDVLDGGTGNDFLSGGDGDDLLIDDDGNDFVVGGEGADTFVFSSQFSTSGFNTIADFEVGVDTLVVTGLADSFDDLNIVLSGGNVAIFFSESQSIVFNNLTDVNALSAADFDFGDGPGASPPPPPVSGEGTEGDDELVGGSEDNVFNGNGGNDFISGEGGNDTLSGSSGNDVIEGGLGADTFVLSAPATGTSFDLITDFQIGVDTLDVSDLADSFDDLNIVLSGGNVAIFFSEIQSVIFTNLTDVSALTADSFLFSTGPGAPPSPPNAVEGTEGNDELVGGSGDDAFNGNGGNDFIAGEGGNDTLFGGSGNDYLEGGNGADTFVFSAPDTGASFDTIADFEIGVDTLDVSALVDSFDDLNIVSSGANVAIFFSKFQSVVFSNLTDVNALTADDFFF